ncbi:MAG: DUF4113 domain-containing protein [Treponema sp.]|nr:DUF4113 domain-containing protein [Treponema sp.]MBR4322366.1 DUF4113 domain-containing protein [Treponema sp.]
MGKSFIKVGWQMKREFLSPCVTTDACFLQFIKSLSLFNCNIMNLVYKIFHVGKFHFNCC